MFEIVKNCYTCGKATLYGKRMPSLEKHPVEIPEILWYECDVYAGKRRGSFECPSWEKRTTPPKIIEEE